MKQRSSLIGLVAVTVALCCGGCSHISVPFIGKKKPSQSEPKQSKLIATETEKEFEARWTEKRSAELISQGQSAETAKTQSEREFMQKFPATTIARMP